MGSTSYRVKTLKSHCEVVVESILHKSEATFTKCGSYIGNGDG